jgi:3-hydroxyacyl-CoA dehydrogenase
MRPDPQQIRHVACIGAGTIGAGWAAYFLSRGLSVAVTDPGPGAEALLHRIIDESWSSLEALGLPPGADRGKVKFFPRVAEAVRGAEFVQESAPDRLELKTALLAEVDGLLPPEVVIASSTSTFLPSGLGAQCKHPGRIIVGHPFAPAHLLPLVEVVGSEATPPELLDWACAFYAALGKRPLRLKKEIQSFIANRLQYAIQDEANRLIDAGVCDYADIDTAMTQGIGLRWAFMGPAICAHLGGGKGGLKHRLEHLGWRGSDATKASLTAAVEALAGATPMDDLERWRDANLVAQRRALKSMNR